MTRRPRAVLPDHLARAGSSMGEVSDVLVRTVRDHSNLGGRPGRRLRRCHLGQLQRAGDRREARAAQGPLGARLGRIRQLRLAPRL
eukprot:1309088-Pyramimonas_sp.AAC.1